MTNYGLWYHDFGIPEHVLTLKDKPFDLLAVDCIRVKMLLTPINASDLIPISGAYRHRITPPIVAGYEGVGVVTEASSNHQHLIGQKVLPLRGTGTWQQYVSCHADFAIPVPDEIDDILACRAYINPVAAMLMLNLYHPKNKRVMITVASSDCAKLLGQWALKLGAREVIGICRSDIHIDHLHEMGIVPVLQNEIKQIKKMATKTDIVFDAAGGELADCLLTSLKTEATFVSYGLLSGQPFSIKQGYPQVQWFHIRNYLDNINNQQWQSMFMQIWSLLKQSKINNTEIFALTNWQQAIRLYHTPKRMVKPLISLSDIE